MVLKLDLMLHIQCSVSVRTTCIIIPVNIQWNPSIYYNGHHWDQRFR